MTWHRDLPRFLLATVTDSSGLHSDVEGHVVIDVLRRMEALGAENGAIIQGTIPVSVMNMRQQSFGQRETDHLTYICSSCPLS